MTSEKSVIATKMNSQLLQQSVIAFLAPIFSLIQKIDPIILKSDSFDSHYDFLTK